LKNYLDLQGVKADDRSVRSERRGGGGGKSVGRDQKHKKAKSEQSSGVAKL